MEYGKEWRANLYKQILKERGKGCIVVNLGACRGEYTKFFNNNIGKHGLIISVEPIIENYRELISVIVKNKLKNVIPIFAAIGDKTGKATINLAPDPKSHTFFPYKEKGIYKFSFTREVPTISWDDLVDALNLTCVDFAKVDIEGAEELLLRGMTKVFPDKMLIEVHSKQKIINTENFENLLKEKFYEVVQKRKIYWLVKKINLPY